MMQSALKLIHLTALDPEPKLASEFERWYLGEYLAKVLERPGCRGVRVFECIDAEPRYVTIYDLDETRVDFVQGFSAAPFHEATFDRRGIRNYHARTYREMHEAGDHLIPPKLINVVTVEVESEHAEEFNRWYNDVHFPEIIACPGWRGGRRYECTDGEPRFLAIYDLDAAEVAFSSAEWKAAVGWDDHLQHIRGFHGFRVYRLVYDSYAPY
jgi:hypothetical protein